jgi:hypothetical protein
MITRKDLTVILRTTLYEEFRQGPRGLFDLIIAARPVIPPEVALWYLRTNNARRRRGTAPPPRPLPPLAARIDSGIRLILRPRVANWVKLGALIQLADDRFALNEPHLIRYEVKAATRRFATGRTTTVAAHTRLITIDEFFRARPPRHSPVVIAAQEDTSS